MTHSAEDVRGARLLIGVMYDGPWERLASWLLAIDPETLELVRKIKDNGVRDRLAAWCDRRHQHWVDQRARRLLATGCWPHPRWKRK